MKDVSRFLAALLASSCGGGDSGDPFQPGGDTSDVAIEWRLAARGFSFGCAAFEDPTVVLAATGSDDNVMTVEVACDEGARVIALPPGGYALRASLQAGTTEIGTASTTVRVPDDDDVAFEFDFDGQRLLGEFSDVFAGIMCPRCLPAEPFCEDEVRAQICGDAGTCEQPTFGADSQLAACRAALQASSCSAQAYPPSCLDFVTTLPGLEPL